MTSTPDSENTSFKTQQFEISFIASNKGKPLLIYENYLFRCNKKNISKKILGVFGTRIWRVHTHTCYRRADMY